MATKNLKIEESKAKKLYKTASPEFKEMLKSTFGIQFFSEKITDRIKTWEDIVEELGEDNCVLPYKSPKTKEQKATNAFVKIQKISEVLNEGWVANFSDRNIYKYCPWFEYKSSVGWVFFCYGSYSYYSSLGVGFYYKSSELAEYAGKQFLEIYKEYLN